VQDPSGQVLALDLGEVRIGLALSDPLGIVAHPLETLHSEGARRDLVRIEQLIRDHEVVRVVVGLPLHLSGEEGAGAAAARRFAARLRGRVPGVELVLWDERLTTVQAERTLRAANVRRGKRREVIDGLAAVLILQNYLDSRAAPQADR
jgi:putative Holliday junction resolvase